MSVRPAPGNPSPVAELPVIRQLPAFRAQGLPMLPIAILVTLALIGWSIWQSKRTVAFEEPGKEPTGGFPVAAGK